MDLFNFKLLTIDEKDGENEQSTNDEIIIATSSAISKKVESPTSSASGKSKISIDRDIDSKFHASQDFI